MIQNYILHGLIFAPTIVHSAIFTESGENDGG